VAFILYAVGIVGGACGLLISFSGGHILVLGALNGCLVLAALAGIRELRYPEFEVAGRLLFRGEFQQVFAQKLRLKELAQSLERAGTRDEWWLLLASAAREWKWVRIEWRAPGALREDVLDTRKPTWSFAIELTQGDSVRVEGDARSTENSPDLISLASVLTRTFQRELPEWREPALL
jgi:hypothetical protein